MATLPADRTKLALAQSNQNPSNVLGSSQNKNAITEAYDTIDLLYNNMTGLISAAQLSKLGIINVKDYNASGSAQTTTGSITAGSNNLTLAATSDFANGQGINVSGKTEVDNLQITSAATVSGNVTVTLNGVAFTVSVLAGDTIAQVATKIRAATYAGWTTGGATDTITFTSTTRLTKTTPVYSAGSTTATGIMTVTTLGSADLITTISSGSGTTTLTLAANATTTVSAVTVAHDDTAALNAALVSLSSGGEIRIPPGTYNFSSTITIPTTGTFIISGAGHGVTILQYTGTGNCLNVYHSTIPLRRFTIKDLKLVGNGASSAYGIYTGNSSEFVFERVWFNNHGSSALRFDGSLNSNAGTFVHAIKECLFTGNLSDCINMIRANAIHVTGSYLSNNTGNGIVADIASQLTIDGATTFETMPSGVKITGADGTNLGFTIVGCFFENITNNSIEIGTSPAVNYTQGGVIMGCKFYGSTIVGSRSIIINFGTEIDIRGNHFYNPTAEAAPLGHISLTANAVGISIGPNAYSTSGNHILVDDLGVKTLQMYDDNLKMTHMNMVGNSYMDFADIVGGNSVFKLYSPRYIFNASPLVYLGLDANSNAMVRGKITMESTGAIILSGAGTPEGNVTAPIGSLYISSAGGAGTTLYVKQSGAGATGWVGK